MKNVSVALEDDYSCADYADWKHWRSEFWQ